MNTTYEPKKKSSTGKILAVILIVLLLLVVTAEFGVRWFMKDQITKAMDEQTAGTSVEQADANVSLGTSPVLLGLIQGQIPSLKIDLPSTVEVSYEDNDRSKPVVTGTPKTTIDGKKLELADAASGDAADMIFGSLRITTEMPKDMILAEMNKAASEESNGAGDGGKEANQLGSMIEITDVKPNVEAQTLDFEITGGLATLTMKPKIGDNDELAFDVDSFKLLGIAMPDALTDQFGKAMADSAQGQLPGKMRAEEINITEDGLTITMFGEDVSMQEMQDSIDESTKQPNNRNRNEPLNDPGAVGSGGEVFNHAAA